MTERPLPIANIPHCGGFIIALNSDISNIPRLDILLKKKVNQIIINIVY